MRLRKRERMVTGKEMVLFPLKFVERTQHDTTDRSLHCDARGPGTDDGERDPVRARERSSLKCAAGLNSHVTRSGHTNEVRSRSRPARTIVVAYLLSLPRQPVPSNRYDRRGRKIVATLRPRDFQPHRSLLLLALYMPVGRRL